MFYQGVPCVFVVFGVIYGCFRDFFHYFWVKTEKKKERLGTSWQERRESYVEIQLQKLKIGVVNFLISPKRAASCEAKMGVYTKRKT